MERLGPELANPLHCHVRSLLKVREVRARNRAARKTFVLQAMEAIAPPPGWPPRAVQQPL